MDQLKVFLITLSKASDAECDPNMLSQITKFSAMLKNKAKDYLIISSPKQECLQFSSNLAKSLENNWCVMRELSNCNKLNYDNNPEAFSSFPPQNPELFNPVKTELVTTLLESLRQHIIIVTEKETIEGSELRYRKRTGNNVALLEIQLKNAGLNKEIELKSGKVSFRNCLRSEIVKTLGGFLPRVQKLFKRVKKSANNLNRSADNTLDMLQVTEYDELYYENQLDYISNQLEKAKKVFNNLESVLKVFGTFKENQIDPQTLKGKIKICKFAYDYFQEAWTLTVKSSHNHKIPNLSVFCIETQQKIHSFKLVQAYSKVSVSIAIQNQELYHKSLVAVVNGVVISDVFTVFPYKLRAVNLNLGYQGIELKVENCSINSYQDVMIATSFSKNAIKLSTELKYNEKNFEKVLLNLSQNTELFLVSGNMCLSNPITIISKEGDN